MATTEDLTVYGRLILQELMVPMWSMDGEGWVEGKVNLLTPRLAKYYTDHSERHFMPSIGVALGLAQEGRQIIGRWGLSRIPDQEYALTASVVTHKAQRKVREALLTRGPELQEGDLLDLKDFLGSDPEGHCLMQSDVARELVRRAGPACVDLEEEHTPTEIAEEVPVDQAAEEVLEQMVAAAPTDQPQTEFWISRTARTQFRRLH
eukprot:6078440-Amphidinium_carterae.1